MTNCQNCGAPLPYGTVASCEYCGTVWARIPDPPPRIGETTSEQLQKLNSQIKSLKAMFPRKLTLDLSIHTQAADNRKPALRIRKDPQSGA